jgi:uncharacterized RDD family membrane protein YckC
VSAALGEQAQARTETTPATRRRRLVAFAFDHFLFTMVGAVAGFATLGPRWDMGASLDRGGVLPMLAVVMALYLCKDVFGGQSIGRAVFAIAVRDAEDPTETPSVGRLVRRNLFLPIWPVELVALLMSERRQRIGDRLADTCVVSMPAPLRPRLLAGLLFSVTVTFAFLGAATHLVRTSAAYAVATAHLRGDTGIAEAVGRVEGFGPMPAGSIQVAEEGGQAELAIVVEGSEGIVRSFVRLEKEPRGEWQVREVRIE